LLQNSEKTNVESNTIRNNDNGTLLRGTANSFQGAVYGDFEILLTNQEGDDLLSDLIGCEIEYPIDEMGNTTTCTLTFRIGNEIPDDEFGFAYFLNIGCNTDSFPPPTTLPPTNTVTINLNNAFNNNCCSVIRNVYLNNQVAVEDEQVPSTNLVAENKSFADCDQGVYNVEYVFGPVPVVVGNLETGFPSGAQVCDNVLVQKQCVDLSVNNLNQLSSRTERTEAEREQKLQQLRNLRSN
jgi:hypothetical protein